MARAKVHRSRRAASLLHPQRRLHRVPEPVPRVQQRGVLPDDQARHHSLHGGDTDDLLRQAVQREGQGIAVRVTRRRRRRDGDGSGVEHDRVRHVHMRRGHHVRVADLDQHHAEDVRGVVHAAFTRGVALHGADAGIHLRSARRFPRRGLAAVLRVQRARRLRRGADVRHRGRRELLHVSRHRKVRRGDVPGARAPEDHARADVWIRRVEQPGGGEEHPGHRHRAGGYGGVRGGRERG
mmetsp:Transcript_666/g.2482  ORF Transcript_666/g.2482 Transcript_666/m.2482 type:complete len:238 (-) Transcript_666:1750-2463(-)